MAQPPRRPSPHPLELIDDATARREQAIPDLGSDEAAYLGHLSALQQLTEIYLHRLLKPYRLSYSEYRVLTTLRIRPRDYRATPHDLNHVAQITSAGMTRTVDRLEASGFVDRIPNPQDRRSVLIGLTDAGWELAETLIRDLNAQHTALVGDLSERERKRELDTLRAIISRVSAAINRGR